ncbi:MAG TPA: AAA family ATPase [Bacteroidia bacterium]|jgi:dephospho-CoA kinase|nr:AAA family ATPase [Bacteroidia bacterium]
MQSINQAIVIIGRICSGKSTLANAISSQLQIPIASFGGFLVNYCKRHNIKIEHRDVLQNLGNTFIQKEPSKFLLDVIEFSVGNSNRIIFEGVRHKIILLEIQKMSKSIFSIFVDVETQERYKRMVRRAKDSDEVKNFDEFLKLDNHIVEKEIELLKPSADLIIGSDYDFEHVIKSLRFL